MGNSRCWVAHFSFCVFALLGASVTLALDGDGDSFDDQVDNCVSVPNADQRDTDMDGFGNICDPDVTNDGIVNFQDLQVIKSAFFSNDPDSDLNGDAIVNFLDLQIVKDFFFGPPGPSGVGPIDSDSDRLDDFVDNCPATYNPFQSDADGDGIGDACETANRSLSLLSGSGTTTNTTINISGESTDQSGMVLVLGGASPVKARFGFGNRRLFRALDVPLRPNQVNVLTVFQIEASGQQTNSSVIHVRQVATGESSLIGTVTDPTGNPLGGVRVSAGYVSTESAPDGSYELGGLSSERMPVLFEKDGYLANEILITPGDVFYGVSDVILTQENTANFVSGTAGGVITTAHGYELVVPPGALDPGQTIYMTEVDAPPGTPVPFDVPHVDLTPDQQFNQPVILRVPNTFGLMPESGHLAIGDSPGTARDILLPGIVTGDGMHVEVALPGVDGDRRAPGQTRFFWAKSGFSVDFDSLERVTVGEPGPLIADEPGQNVNRVDEYTLCSLVNIAPFASFGFPAYFAETCQKFAQSFATAQPCEIINYTIETNQYETTTTFTVSEIVVDWSSAGTFPFAGIESLSLQSAFIVEVPGFRQQDAFAAEIVSIPIDCNP